MRILFGQNIRRLHISNDNRNDPIGKKVLNYTGFILFCFSVS